MYEPQTAAKQLHIMIVPQVPCILCSILVSMSNATALFLFHKCFHPL
jgi:hypothetical protein